MLIRDTYLGKALAQPLGSSNCILMRGPGSTTTGPSIDVAVYRAIYAEVNTKLQMQATALGPINFLTQEEAALAAVPTQGQVRVPWTRGVQQFKRQRRAVRRLVR